jgi:hypothetical protein
MDALTYWIIRKRPSAAYIPLPESGTLGLPEKHRGLIM